MIEKVTIRRLTTNASTHQPEREVVRVKPDDFDKEFILSFFTEHQSYHQTFPWDFGPREIAQGLRHLADVIDEDIKKEGSGTREVSS